MRVCSQLCLPVSLTGADGSGACSGLSDGAQAGQQLVHQAVLGQRRRVHAAPRVPVRQRGETPQRAVRHLPAHTERPVSGVTAPGG